MVSSTANDPLTRGRVALARGVWLEAGGAYDEALARSPSPEAWEGRSWASWWLDDVDSCLAAREHAFHLYRQAGDTRGAARMALWIGDDHIEFRGAEAVAEGWFARAARLLDKVEPSPEHGWLAVFDAHARLEGDDPVGALARASEARELGRQFGVVDLEMFSLATEGMAMIARGEVEAGMRCLDEASAAALAGEFESLVPAAWTCCRMLSACELARDFDRGGQWCEQIQAFSRRLDTRFLTGVCHTHYAAILMWRGKWLDADQELTAALEYLTERRPSWRTEAIVRLGDLRRRQGRFADAEELFIQAGLHAVAMRGLGELYLDCGEPVAARDVLERCLRRLPADTRLPRAWLLEPLIRALVAVSDHDAAQACADELGAIAAVIPTEAVRAAALLADGVVAASAGRHEPARLRLEDAIDLLTACRTPIECARARLELARTLVALGHPTAAEREARAALAEARGVGADRECQRAEALLSSLNQSTEEAALLTARQVDVLRLVAEGLSDKEIAARLLLSEHTVHRHVGNIYTRLGCSTRAAAVAQAGRLGLL